MSQVFSYKIDREQRRLISTAEGTITAQDIFEHINFRDGQGLLGFDQLIDLREASMKFSSQENERLAFDAQSRSSKIALGKTAFLVTDLHSFGMARMYGSLASPKYTVNVFRTLEEALAWLGWDSLESDPKK